MGRELALFDGGVLKDPVLQLLLQEAESYDTILNSDYIRMIAHDLAKKDDDA